MTLHSNLFIGDIIEINKDIANEKTPEKFISSIFFSIKRKYYLRRLNNAIKKLKSKNIILNKFNLQELFMYIIANNSGSYKSINSIDFYEQNDESIYMATITIYTNNEPDISYIRYNINTNTKDHLFTIMYTVVPTFGYGTYSDKIAVSNLYYTKDYDNISSYNRQYNTNFILKILNDELVNILESYLLEYIDKFWNNKENVGEDYER